MSTADACGLLAQRVSLSVLPTLSASFGVGKSKRSRSSNSFVFNVSVAAGGVTVFDAGSMSGKSGSSSCLGGGVLL